MLNKVDREFHSLYERILKDGALKEDRTGVGTIMLPAQTMRFDCRDGKMPILSTRKIHTRSFIHEMLWFISGESSIKYLRDNKVGIWDSWFIKGTDKYDEPVTKYLAVEERLKLPEAINRWEEIDFTLKTALENAIGVGSAQLEMVTPDGTVIEYRNLNGQVYSEFSKYLDTLQVPTHATPAIIGLDLNQRLTWALDHGHNDAVYEYSRVLPGSADHQVAQITLKDRNGDRVVIGLGKSHVNELNDFLTSLGAPTVRSNGSDPISLQRRLARVSKNDTDKWDAINRVIDEDWESLRVNWVGESILNAEDSKDYVVFREGKFQTVTLIPLVAACVNERLNQLKVPAYELLDADIGQGGYGPQWRKWQDTQMVHHSDKATYEAQGYHRITEIQVEHASYDYAGLVIMHREIDQLQNVIDKLMINPDDRRMIVTAHNPGRTWQAALPPCHLYFQFVTRLGTEAELFQIIEKSNLVEQFKGELATTPMRRNQTRDFMIRFCNKHSISTRYLTLYVQLRSNDVPLGAVFNVAQYALLLHMVAQVVNMEPDELISMGVDSHIYLNQVDHIKELLERESPETTDPRVVFKRQVASIDDFTFDDIEIVGYESGPELKIPVAV